MKKSTSARDRYPIVSMFGVHHEFLDGDAALAATTSQRIVSVWPFIIKRAKSFFERLKPRERANWDFEDIASELYAVIAERDADWKPERGKYITYVGVLIDHALQSIQDRSHTVHSPRNTSGRLKEYEADEEAGTISAKRRLTAGDIKRTSDPMAPIQVGGRKDGNCGHEPILASNPLTILLRLETERDARDSLSNALKGLTSYEQRVIGALAGLFGQPQMTPYGISFETGTTLSEVRKAQNKAIAKIRANINAVRFPKKSTAA